MTRDIKSADRHATFAARLDALDTMGHAALKAEWVKLYGVPAPKKIGKDFLRHAIAWRLHEKAFGGLKPSVRRKLLRLAKDTKETPKVDCGASAAQPRPALQPGARLIRECRVNFLTY